MVEEEYHYSSISGNISNIESKVRILDEVLSSGFDVVFEGPIITLFC